MAFGTIMRFTVEGKSGPHSIELAPPTRESMAQFVAREHGGGMQQHSVIRYLGMGTAPTLEDEYDWYDKTRQDKDSLVWGIWLVEGSERTIIGTTALNGIGKDGHTGFIRQATSGSLIFRKDLWNEGIASAAHKARTWYAFQQLGLHRVKSAVIRENHGSSTALSRSGYTLVYTERNEQYTDGKLLHLDCFECLNPHDLFWRQWWHGDRVPAASQRARTLTRQALAWAEQHVTLA